MGKHKQKRSGKSSPPTFGGFDNEALQNAKVLQIRSLDSYCKFTFAHLDGSTTEAVDIVRWLDSNLSQSYQTTFDNTYHSDSKRLDHISIVVSMAIRQFFEKDFKNWSHEQQDEFGRDFYDHVLFPLLHLQSSQGFFEQRARNAHRKALMRYIKTPFYVKYPDGDKMWIPLMADPMGMDAEEYANFWKTYRIDFETNDVLQDVFRGFKRILDDAINYCGPDVMNPFLAWYYYDLGLGASRRWRRRVLIELQNICKTGDDRAKEVVLSLYEDNEAEFCKLFAEFPSFDYIEHGIYESYKTADDLASGIKVTIGNQNSIADLFDPLRLTPSKPTGQRRSPRRRVVVDKVARKLYREYVVTSMDEIFRGIIHHDPRAYYINYNLNRIKDFSSDKTEEKSEDQAKVVKLSGKHIGIVFFWNNEYWILAESVNPGSAVYVWHGEYVKNGIDILMQNRTYARSQAGISHSNHHVSTEHLTDTYKRALKKGNCSILNEA